MLVMSAHAGLLMQVERKTGNEEKHCEVFHLDRVGMCQFGGV
jgi:hypothetical protein